MSAYQPSLASTNEKTESETERKTETGEEFMMILYYTFTLSPLLISCLLSSLCVLDVDAALYRLITLHPSLPPSQTLIPLIQYYSQIISLSYIFLFFFIFYIISYHFVCSRCWGCCWGYGWCCGRLLRVWVVLRWWHRVVWCHVVCCAVVRCDVVWRGRQG